MKKFVFGAVALALAAAPAAAQDGHDHGDHGDHAMTDFTGTYAGSYTCVDGEHGFFLNLGKTDMTDAGWLVDGTLGFFPTLAGVEGPAGTVAGSFVVSGMVTKADEDGDMMIKLEPGEWLVQPAGYGAAALEGVVTMTDSGGWQIVGKPVVPGFPAACDALIATQFLPAATE